MALPDLSEDLYYLREIAVKLLPFIPRLTIATRLLYREWVQEDGFVFKFWVIYVKYSWVR